MALSQSNPIDVIRGCWEPMTKASVSVASYRIYAAASQLLLAIMLGAELGAAGYGIFAYLTAIGMTVAFFARFGFDVLLVRTIARFNNAGSSDQIFKMIFCALFTALAVTSISGIFLFSLSELLPGSLIKAEGPHLGVSLAFGIIMTLHALASSVLRGQFRIKQAYFPEFVIIPSLSLISIFIVSAVGLLTPVMGLSVLLASWSVSLILVGTWAIKTLPAAGMINLPSVSYTYSSVREGGLILMSGLLGAMIGRLDLFILGQTVDSETIGAYAIAARFAQLASLPRTAIEASLMPTIANLHEQHREADIQEHFNNMVRIELAVTILMGLAIFTAAHLLLKDFEGADLAAAIITIGFIGRAACGPGYVVMTMLNMAGPLAVISIANSSAFAILLIVFVPYIGAIGAAIAFSIVMTWHSGLLSVIVHQRTGLRCDFFTNNVLKRRSEIVP